MQAYLSRAQVSQVMTKEWQIDRKKGKQNKRLGKRIDKWKRERMREGERMEGLRHERMRKWKYGEMEERKSERVR